MKINRNDRLLRLFSAVMHHERPCRWRLARTHSSPAGPAETPPHDRLTAHAVRTGRASARRSDRPVADCGAEPLPMRTVRDPTDRTFRDAAYCRPDEPDRRQCPFTRGWSASLALPTGLADIRPALWSPKAQDARPPRPAGPSPRSKRQARPVTAIRPSRCGKKTRAIGAVAVRRRTVNVSLSRSDARLPRGCYRVEGQN